jgi:hypothetical protein
MRHLIKFLFIGIFITSCSGNEDSSENNVVNEPLITKMNTNVFNPGSLPYNQAELIFSFEYNTDLRLTKKIGGFLTVSGSSGYSGLFTDKIYTSLIYTGQNVTVENFSSSLDFTVPLNTKYFTLNYLNQIDKKEIPNSNNYWLKKQTFNYLNNKLIEIKTTLPNMPYDPTDPNDYLLTYLEKFYYDTNGNLTKSEYFEQHNEINKGEKVIRTFENYDNSYNPCKRLQLLDEYFYRSLSKNNYRKYTERHYNNDVLGLANDTSWAFNYDTNGQIIIN